MIGEFVELKKFLNNYFMVNYTFLTIDIIYIYCKEFNALEINMLECKLSQKVINKIESSIRSVFGDIIISVESAVYGNSILIYLNTPSEIRVKKVKKIKNKICV